MAFAPNSCIQMTYRVLLSVLLMIFIGSRALCSAQTAYFPSAHAGEADRITTLPGQPHVAFAQYSGYITVNESHGRALFYWFFEAAKKPQSKPLVLWFNGGPGCSSVGYGAVQELGPFKVNVNGTGLHLNKYSWNRDANIVFVESPAGVGFSYTNVSSDLYNFGDKLASEDAYTFLIRWLERFSEYKSHDFYLAGESYAGHYVPQLANLVYDRNHNASIYPSINLKGFMVGNPSTDDNHDWNGVVDYAWTHAVISDELYVATKNACDFRMEKWTDACLTEVEKIFSQYKEIDIYNLYKPICNAQSSSDDHASRFFDKYPSKPRLLASGRPLYPAGYDPCVVQYAGEYFNRPDVQKALHANVTGIPYQWTVCSNIVSSNWTDSAFSILPIYHKLIAAGLRIWVYSGDVDGRIPATATRATLNALNLPIKTPWQAWFHNAQVGGWTEELEGGLVYATVRGSGHLVPFNAPSEALAIFSSFLAAKSLPTTRYTLSP